MATQLRRKPPIKGKELSGLRFGRLLVIRFYNHSRTPGGKCYRLWLCLCNCGKESIVPQGDLEHHRSTSCGCRSKECLSFRTKHGFSSSKSQHRLYSTHEGMMSRCNNPKSSGYYLYGARGIKVCDRWRSFVNFIEDMGPTWREGLTLDRKDVNGNYEPSNCKWSTDREQANNRRCNRYITILGITRTFSEWCRLQKVNHACARGRLNMGWSAERAFEVEFSGIDQLNCLTSD